MKRTRFLSLFLALLLALTLTAPLSAAAEEEHEHQWVELSRTEATCEKMGEIHLRCWICYAEHTGVIQPLGHDFVSEADFFDYVFGYVYRKCWRCEKTIRFTLEEYEKQKSEPKPEPEPPFEPVEFKHLTDHQKQLLSFPVGEELESSWHGYFAELDPGLYTMTVSAEGYATRNYKVMITEGVVLEHDVYLNTTGVYGEEAVGIEAGWQQSGGCWRYQNADGTWPANEWQAIDGAWYHFDGSGVMQTGWQAIDGRWYYLKPSGAMAVGWVGGSDGWYYCDASGAMRTGWVSDGGAWYHMDGSGRMQVGWLWDGGGWYYLTPSGAMAVGWRFIGGAWYYFNASGAMQTGWQLIGGVWYYFSAAGYMHTGWLQLGSAWYYLKPSGAMAAGETIGGYSFGADGLWIE